MGIKKSLNSALANLAQQGSLAAALLIVPHLLSTSDYGRVVALSVLISIAPLADWGLGAVLNRRLPGLLAQNKTEEVVTWCTTVLRFRVMSAMLFGAGLALVHLVRGGEGPEAVLIAAITIASTISTHLIARAVVTANFITVRDSNALQAIARLLVIPGSALAKVTGWCTGQLIALLTVISMKRLRAVFVADWYDGNYSLPLIKKYLPEALLLGLISNIWQQLLASGRLFASFFYPEEVLAQYGLANALSQAAGALLIAVYMPQTVKIYSLLSLDRKKALDYAVGKIFLTQPLVIVMVAAGLYVAPIFLQSFYSGYHVSSSIIRPLLLCLISYPVLCTLGSLLIGAGLLWQYLLIVSVSLLLIPALCLNPWIEGQWAAVGQLFGVSFCAILLIITIIQNFTIDRGVLMRLLLSTAIILTVGVGYLINQ